MSLHDDRFGLYRIAGVTPAGACVQAQLQYAGIRAERDISRTFCDPNTVALLTRAARTGGYLTVVAEDQDREPTCLPATVALSIRIDATGGGDIRVWAMPRPAALYVDRQDEALLQRLTQAQAQGQAMVFAVEDGMVARDGATLTTDEAEALLGFGSRRR